MQNELQNILEEICLQDPRYSEDAYTFVLEALNFTQKKFRRSRHVTGKELLEGVKILLMQKFGPLTLTVLNHWGIKTTEDFGHIVFNLIGCNVLSRTEEDRLEDFRDVYDFAMVFDQGYRRGLNKRISRLR